MLSDVKIMPEGAKEKEVAKDVALTIAAGLIPGGAAAKVAQTAGKVAKTASKVGKTIKGVAKSGKLKRLVPDAHTVITGGMVGFPFAFAGADKILTKALVEDDQYETQLMNDYIENCKDYEFYKNKWLETGE